MDGQTMQKLNLDEDIAKHSIYTGVCLNFFNGNKERRAAAGRAAPSRTRCPGASRPRPGRPSRTAQSRKSPLLTRCVRFSHSLPSLQALSGRVSPTPTDARPPQLYNKRQHRATARFSHKGSGRNHVTHTSLHKQYTYTCTHTHTYKYTYFYVCVFLVCEFL